MICTERLRIYASDREGMEEFISRQTVDVLKSAYQEMLDGSLKHPEQWEWYSIWMIGLTDGTHVGELCFKGLNADGTAEIGYGISEEYEGRGFATEAVSAAVSWALKQPGALCITAETDDENTASKRVLEKSGFTLSGTRGEEGPVYICRREAL